MAIIDEGLFRSGRTDLLVEPRKGPWPETGAL